MTINFGGITASPHCLIIIWYLRFLSIPKNIFRTRKHERVSKTSSLMWHPVVPQRRLAVRRNEGCLQVCHLRKSAPGKSQKATSCLLLRYTENTPRSPTHGVQTLTIWTRLEECGTQMNTRRQHKSAPRILFLRCPTAVTSLVRSTVLHSSSSLHSCHRAPPPQHTHTHHSAKAAYGAYSSVHKDASPPTLPPAWWLSLHH